MLRTFGVILLSLLLCVSLFGANAALAVDRGPMDPDHMSESLDEAGVYTYVHAEIVDIAVEEAGSAEIAGAQISLSDVIADVIGPDLIQQEVERNIEDVYAYIQADSDTLVVSIDTDSVESEAQTVLRNEIDEIDYSALGFEELDHILESEDAYEQERQAIRSDLMSEFGVTPENGFGNPTLEDMVSDETSYVETRDELYEQTGGDEEVLEANIDIELPEETPSAVAEEADALEALMVDAVASELPFEAFITDYDQISDDIESAVATHVWDNRDDYQDEIDQVFQDSANVPDALQSDVAAFETLALEAVLTDLTYDEFSDRVDAAESDLIDAVVAYVFQEEAAFPSEIDVSEEIEQEAGEDWDLLRTIFGMIGTGALLLSVFSLAMVGSVYAISRDLSTTAIATGVPASLVGGISYGGGTIAPSVISDLAHDGGTGPEAIEVLEAFLVQLLSPWATQSMFLLGSGILLTIGGIAIRFGVIELGGASTSSGGAEAENESRQLSDDAPSPGSEDAGPDPEQEDN